MQKYDIWCIITLVIHMSLIIKEIEFLEYNLKKMLILKEKMKFDDAYNRENIDSVNKRIKEIDDLILSKYLELEQIKK